jgi:hypothetical protein
LVFTYSDAGCVPEADAAAPACGIKVVVLTFVWGQNGFSRGRG